MARAACAIVPPFILERLALSGDDPARVAAVRAIEASERLRGRREAWATPPRPRAAARRVVCDARHALHDTGPVVRREGQRACGDRAADEAFDGAGIAYAFYAQVLRRDSLDGRGMRIASTVHYGRRYDNAFWDGACMVYGDGDGRYFRGFTRCLDVIGHELTHGVTQHTARLPYHGEPGALNESMSDVFGSLVKQYALGQEARRADWLIGAGLFTRRVRGQALRSMARPGTAFDDRVLGPDPQPAHMRDYDDTSSDNGGVHINSGIPNHAFYLVATRLGGFAWERAGRIWYDALTRRLGPRADFAAAARATRASAARMYGPRSAEAQAVRAAWRAVGVG